MQVIKIIFNSVLVLILCLLPSTAFTWNDSVTHKDLSEIAVNKSIIGTSNYLESLGLTGGLLHLLELNTKKLEVYKWIAEGAELEDAGSKWDAIIGRARYVNHFHDPTKEWNGAGLSDFQSGESSLLWAQDSARQETFIEEDWSWEKIRLVYYWALISTTEELRQMNFAQAFRGLGHQMHLIQDTAQPAHVRNDAHPMDALEWTNGLETWAKNHKATVNSFASSPTFPQVDLAVDITYEGNNYSPITQFIDTKQYKNNLIPDTSLTWGLSEYTNSNFASDDTIFTENFSQNDKHYFPYPRYSPESYVMYEVDISPSKKRIYLRKQGDGENIEHFATAGPLYKYLDFDPVLQRDELKLDPVVHQDYAQKLIPRAVGYSAGLLNYFFRGKMGIVHLPPDTFKIANLSDEDMEGNLSSFKLYYDDTNDNRFEIPLEFYDASGTKHTDPNTVLVITAQATSAFKVKLTGIPLYPKIPGEYMLVFKGKLGYEGAVPYDTDYAVAAQIIRPRINILQTGTDEFQIVNLSDGDIEGNLGSFRLFYDDTNDVQQEVLLDFYDENDNPLTNPNTIHTIATQTKSTFKIKLNSLPQNPKVVGEYMLTFKGKIGNKGTAPYDTDYAETEQEITPHFLTHVEVNGQWDIYEYDLLGNRIYNVTGGLQRGVPHHHAIPNPDNPDLVVFQSDISCPENDPQPWTVCSRILTKSSGALEVVEWIRVPWWSNDGQRVYGVDGGYYDLSTGTFEPGAQWSVDGATGVCGFVSTQSPSFSSDESMLAAEMLHPLYNPYRVDIVIYEPGLTIYNPPTPTDIIDMNSFSLATTDYLNICNDYIDDEIYFDITPDFHPSDDRIVFTSNAGGLYDVYHTDFTTRDIQQLTTALSGDLGYYEPSWSPDGQLILLVGEVQGEVPQIYTMPEAGGTLNQITEDEKPHYYPQWMKYLGQ